MELGGGVELPEENSVLVDMDFFSVTQDDEVVVDFDADFDSDKHDGEVGFVVQERPK